MNKRLHLPYNFNLIVHPVFHEIKNILTFSLLSKKDSYDSIGKKIIKEELWDYKVQEKSLEKKHSEAAIMQKCRRITYSMKKEKS